MQRTLFSTLAIAGLMSLSAATAHAQAPTITVFGHAGGISSLTDLNEAGDTKLKTGYNVGGGIGIQIHPLVGLRGNVAFSRSEAEGPLGTLNGENIDRWYYGADLQLSAPVTGIARPYALLGGGAITMEGPNDLVLSSTTNAYLKTGLGVEFRRPLSRVGLFGEAVGMTYKFDNLGQSKTQFDVMYSAGLAFHF